MLQLDPDVVAVIVGPIAGVAGVTLFTLLIIRFKLKKKELEIRGSDPELGPEVDALRDDLNDTRAQLADMQERLDFAERLLTAGRASQYTSTIGRHAGTPRLCRTLAHRRPCIAG
jgi:hypothetical protein